MVHNITSRNEIQSVLYYILSSYVNLLGPGRSAKSKALNYDFTMKLKYLVSVWNVEFHEIMGLDVNVESYLLQIYDLYEMTWFSVFYLGLKKLWTSLCLKNNSTLLSQSY